MSLSAAARDRGILERGGTRRTGSAPIVGWAADRLSRRQRLPFTAPWPPPR